MQSNVKTMVTDLIRSNNALLEKLSEGGGYGNDGSNIKKSSSTKTMFEPYSGPQSGFSKPSIFRPASLEAPTPGSGADTLTSGRWNVTRYEDLTIDDCAEVLTADALTLLRAEEGLTQSEKDGKVINQLTELLLEKEVRTLPERKDEKMGKFDCGTKDNSESPANGPIPNGNTTTGGGASSLKFGGFLDDQKIYFWRDDSVVRFYLDGNTFRSQERFSIVEKAFCIVALAWTRIAPGATSFIRVYTASESDYVVRYVDPGPRPNTLASATPPAYYARGENDISVYPRAFDSDSVGIMSNIMAHEFGHVVGLRHSFAQQQEATLESGSYEDDPTSVMSYNFPPKININDVKNTRDIYRICVDGSVNRFPFQGNWLLFTTVRVAP